MFMAPEILRGGEYNGQTIDLYAAAIILITMVGDPFEMATDNNPCYSFLVNNNHEAFWE